MTATKDWHPGGPGLHAWFAATSHAHAAALARAIAAALPSGQVLPDLEVRRTGIRVGIAADAEALADTISEHAGQLGLTPDARRLQRVRLRIDSTDPSRLLPFWSAVADLERITDGVLVDRLHRRPALEFVRAAAVPSVRNRFHLDVPLPGARDDTVSSALAADGREAFSCQWYSTLADADANEVDVVPGGPWEDERTADWSLVFGAMVRYPTDSAARAAAFAAAAAELADTAGIDLMIDVRPDAVVLDSGKDQWEEVAGFADLAAALQGAARAAGLAPDNEHLRFTQIALDAVDVPTVREFWRTLLGYVHAPNQDYFDLFDPDQLGPVLFFQQMDAGDAERLGTAGRIRLELEIPVEQLPARVQRALDAGGRIVTQDADERRFVVADPEGNEAVLRAGGG